MTVDRKLQEWEKICKEFCRQQGYDLVFVKSDNFGYVDKNGNMVHLYVDELASILSA